jgi:hypothetical protein
MSNVINSVYGITQRDKGIDNVHIPAAVLGQTVDDQQHSPWLTFRQPALVIDARIPNPFERPLLMSHFSISSVLGAQTIQNSITKLERWCQI